MNYMHMYLILSLSLSLHHKHRTGACLKSLVGGSVTCFQPVGNKDLVAGESNGTVRIWDIAAGTCTHAFNGNGHPVTGIECDGEKIVAGSTDHSIKVYDYKGRRHVTDLKDHTGPINGLQFDGRKVVSASADNCLKVRPNTPPTLTSHPNTHSRSP